MTQTQENYFTELSQIDVGDHIEKKGKFSYLSWPFAVSTLRKKYPKATWEVIRFNGLPFLTTEFGVFVEVAVTVEEVTLSQLHPVLDNSNKPILKPTAFQINTSLQRALVKAMALHGLGLYIYAGEDLPDTSESSDKEKLAAIADEDIGEVRSQMNKDTAEKIKQALRDCETLAEIADVKVKSEKEIKRLQKYVPDIFEEIVEVAISMKKEIEESEGNFDDSDKLAQI